MAPLFGQGRLLGLAAVLLSLAGGVQAAQSPVRVGSKIDT